MAANSAQMAEPMENQLLIEAVEVTLNPEVDQQTRNKALEYIEAFKQESQQCAKVGISLFNKDNSPIVRHLGLQLLEHAIKFKWNSMEEIQQDYIKCKCLELIANGTKPMLEEPLHIKESLARVIVELIKREWPQKWEILMLDLTLICKMGETQTELTLMVFLRMAEDIINMDSHLNQHRKREITQALHLHMESLFTFFINTLRHHTTDMIALKKNPSSPHSQILIHQQVAKQTLRTLLGYLEWVKVSVLFMQDFIIPQMLCLLLNQKELRIQAAECLLMFISRKGKLDVHQEYARMFSPDALQFIKTAASQACQAEYDEQQYLFMKRLCQVVTTLGSVQLTQIWNKERPDAKPETFSMYLETVVIFSRVNSLALAHLTNSLLLVFLRNDMIVMDKDIKAIMPLLLEMAKSKILRIDNLESDDDGTSEFNREDFNTNSEFNYVFTQVRSQVMEIIRIVSHHFPVETFLKAAEWLLDNIDKTQTRQQSGVKLRSLQIQWDGVCCYMTAVMWKLSTVQNIKELLTKIVTIRGMTCTLLDLAKSCIQSLIATDISDTFNDPTILSDIADIIQAMLSFLTHAQELILDVLKKIFSLVTYNTTGKPEGPWTVDILHTRRSACSALLKMCSEYGNLLVPLFGELKKHVTSLFDGELVTILDRTTLTEALIVTSNFVDTSEQIPFIESLLSHHKELLIDNRDSISVEWLVAFLQMDKSPAEYKFSGEVAKRRSKLILALTTLLAIARRCSPAQKTCCSDRSSIGLTPDEASAHNVSPCSSQVILYLPSLLNLIKAVNNLYGTIGKSLMCSDYIASLGMHASEKTAFFGVQSDVQRTTETHDAVAKTKRYIYHLTESCYTTLGQMGAVCGSDLYSQSGLDWFINNQVIFTLQHLPNYRLRPVIRHFIKPFILNCNPEYYPTTLVPVLAQFFNFMLQHLEEEWQTVKSHQTESVGQESQDQQDTYSQEVIEDQLVHIVTKDYMDVFYLACTFKSNKAKQTEESQEEMKDGDQEMDSSKQNEELEAMLGPLGELLMQSPSVNMQLLTTVFASMTWPDSSACCKAGKLSITFVKKAITMAEEMGSAIAANVIEALYIQILMGFQVQGEVGQIMLHRVGLVLYELLRKQYPSLKEIVLQKTGCSLADIKILEEMLFGNKPRSEKNKKDQFKKLVANILGKPLGELFKDEIKIKDLPAIKFPKKHKETADNEESLGLAELFDPQNTTELI